jgi:predicted ArsR family transcriptional regulator
MSTIDSKHGSTVAGERIHASWMDVLGDSIRLRLLEGLVGLGEASTAELSEQIKASEPALRRHLETMVALGLAVERHGASDGLTPGRPATRYLLLPDVKERAIRLFELLAEPLS